MLVWDDTTNNMGLHAGVMATHDQDTYSYFKGTEVTCVLCPRQGGEEDSILQVKHYISGDYSDTHLVH